MNERYVGRVDLGLYRKRRPLDKWQRKRFDTTTATRCYHWRRAGRSSLALRWRRSVGLARYNSGVAFGASCRVHKWWLRRRIARVTRQHAVLHVTDHHSAHLELGQSHVCSNHSSRRRGYVIRNHVSTLPTRTDPFQRSGNCNHAPLSSINTKFSWSFVLDPLSVMFDATKKAQTKVYACSGSFIKSRCVQTITLLCNIPLLQRLICADVSLHDHSVRCRSH